MVKCSTCGEILLFAPSKKKPCTACGYNPKRGSKHRCGDGERNLCEWSERGFGFRLAWGEKMGLYDN